jgi:hypothetical protein
MSNVARTDRWGVPDSMFGPIDEDLAGLIGRIAMVSALLESETEMLAAKLLHSPQEEFAGIGFRDALDAITKQIKAVDSSRRDLPEPTRATAESLIERLTTTTRLRNEVIHGVWARPTVRNGYAWKHLPKRRQKSPQWSPAISLGGDGLHGVLLQLVEEHFRVRELQELVERAPLRL